jgi:anti-sigma B factor antagonist
VTGAGHPDPGRTGQGNTGQKHDVLTLSVGRLGDTALIVVSGELDLYSCDRLTDAVTATLETEVRAIEVDAAGVRFADSAGLRALLVARADAANHGASLRLTAVSAQLDRLLSLTGLHDVFLGGSL